MGNEKEPLKILSEEEFRKLSDSKQALLIYMGKTIRNRGSVRHEKLMKETVTSRLTRKEMQNALEALFAAGYIEFVTGNKYQLTKEMYDFLYSLHL